MSDNPNFKRSLPKPVTVFQDDDGFNHDTQLAAIVANQMIDAAEAFERVGGSGSIDDVHQLKEFLADNSRWIIDMMGWKL